MVNVKGLRRQVLLGSFKHVLFFVSFCVENLLDSASLGEPLAPDLWAPIDTIQTDS